MKNYTYNFKLVYNFNHYIKIIFLHSSKNKQFSKNRISFEQSFKVIILEYVKLHLKNNEILCIRILVKNGCNEVES